MMFAGEAPPLDPYEARAKLMLTIWLAAELTGHKTGPAPGGSDRRPMRSRKASGTRRIRRGTPVRPPRAC
jgi:hypothetical protein